MKRTLLTGILALAAGISASMAQAPPAGQPAGQTGAAPATTQAPAVTQQSLVQALSAAQSSGNPDAMIKAAENLLTQFPETPAKEAAITIEAAAYQMKRDNVAARAKWEDVLKIDPKSIEANLKIGEIIATGIKEKDLDKDDEVAQATKYLNAALDILKTGVKPNPQLPDATWEEIKKEMDAEAHDALGMMNLNIKKYDAAIQEFQVASTEDPEPTYSARLATALDQAGKHADAIALCDKILADPQLDPRVKDYATKLKTQATNAQNAPAAK